jgi:hypothetical protein
MINTDALVLSKNRFQNILTQRRKDTKVKKLCFDQYQSKNIDDIKINLIFYLCALVSLCEEY